MAYTIRKSDNSILAVVQDATLNTTASSLTLVGRDYAGYGAFLNENFVYLLENFANDASPSHQTVGQLWYDTDAETLKVNTDGTANGWKPISSSIAQDTRPASGTLGDLWFNTQTYQLSIYTDDIAVGDLGWQLIGPPNTGGALNGAVVDSITDTSGGSHIAIIFYINNNAVAIMSYDSPAYTPANSIDGFSIINPGLNLISSSTLSGSQFTGDSSNALYLNGISSGQFLRSDQNSSSAYNLTLGGGLTVATDLNIVADTAQDEVRFNGITNNRDMNFYANVSGSPTLLLGLVGDNGTVRLVNGNVTVALDGSITTASGQLTIGGTSRFNGATTFGQDITPANVGSMSIGNVAYTFGNVFSNKFHGNLIASNVYVATGTVLGNFNVNGNIFIASSLVASQNWVTTYVQTSGRNSQGTRTVSSSAPGATVGSDGDIWYQV